MSLVIITMQKLLSLLRKCTSQYKMIEDGDKIAVGLSGGKDSSTLLKLLKEYQRFSPERFELVAITVDLGFNGKQGDFTVFENYCKELGVEYHIVRTQIGEVVFDVRKEKSPCALCAKMRKGALYGKAAELGCNKVALGHHADDLIETMLLSLFYEGRLSTFSPKSFLDRSGLTLIRPMLFIKESFIKPFASDLPVKESLCPANDNTKREYAKEVLAHISKEVPNIREMMFTAIVHPERYNLFDKMEKE